MNWEDTKQASKKQDQDEEKRRAKQRRQEKKKTSENKSWRSDHSYNPRSRQPTKTTKNKKSCEGSSDSNSEHQPKKANNYQYNARIRKLLLDGRDLVENPKLQRIVTIAVLEGATTISGHQGLGKLLVKAVTEYVRRHSKTDTSKIYHPAIPKTVLHDSDNSPFISLTLLHPSNHPASISLLEKKNLLDKIILQVKGSVLKQGKGMLN